MPQIVIDTREAGRHPDFVQHLNRLGNARVEWLESGDFVCSHGIGIERKTLSNILLSLRTRQLFRQLRVLRDTYKIPILLIEGDLKRPGEGSPWSQYEFNRIMGTEIAIAASMKEIRMITTHSEDETKDYLAHFMTYSGTSSNVIVPEVVKKGDTPKQTYLNMLMCVRGIGPKGAKKIYNVAKNWKELIHCVETMKPQAFRKKVKPMQLNIIKKLWRLLS